MNDNKSTARFRSARAAAHKGGESPYAISFSGKDATRLQSMAREGRTGTLVIEVRPNSKAQIREIVDETVADVRPLPEPYDVMAEAERRGAKRAADILSDACMLTGEEMAQRLGTTRQSVNAKRQRRELLGLVGNVRGHKYPDWQLRADDTPYPALPEIADRLGGDAWTLYRFLVRSHLELGGASGIEALRRGRDRELIAVAESHGRGDFA